MKRTKIEELSGEALLRLVAASVGLPRPGKKKAEDFEAAYDGEHAEGAYQTDAAVDLLQGKNVPAKQEEYRRIVIAAARGKLDKLLAHEALIQFESHAGEVVSVTRVNPDTPEKEEEEGSSTYPQDLAASAVEETVRAAIDRELTHRRG
jgi:hypothetical protein